VYFNVSLRLEFQWVGSAACR